MAGAWTKLWDGFGGSVAGLCGGEDSGLTAFLEFSRDEDFIKNPVGPCKVKDEIEFADVAKVGIKDLDEHVEEFHGEEFVVLGVCGGDKVETCVAFVDYFVVSHVDYVAHF